MKKLFGLLVALAVFSVSIEAASWRGRQEDLLLGTNKAEYNDYNDSSPFSVLTAAGTASTMTITGSTVTLQVGTSYRVSLNLTTSAYDTVGEVFDAINSTHSGVYTAVAIDMRRAENSTYLGDVVSQSLATTYNVLFDSAVAGGGHGSDALYTQIALTPARGKRIRLFKVTGNADVASAASTDVIIIYKEAAGTYAETLVMKSPILTDETDKDMTFTTNQPYGGLDFKEGETVIIKTQGDEKQDAGAGTYVSYMEW